MQGGGRELSLSKIFYKGLRVIKKFRTNFGFAKLRKHFLCEFDLVTWSANFILN